jgi:hypothetical protein
MTLREETRFTLETGFLFCEDEHARCKTSRSISDLACDGAYGRPHERR